MSRKAPGANASIYTEGTPCSPCTHSARCGKDLLACQEFQRFLGTGGSSVWTGPIHPASRRFPTREIYVKVHAHHPTTAEQAWRKAGQERIKRRAGP